MRIDKFLKVSRLIKRRTVAREACDGGRVSINGRQAKPGAEVRNGDTVTVAFGNRTIRVEVLETRESASLEQARQMYRVVEETIRGITS
ncbi:MAG: RNA-binding S4 domain-containing protein [Ignavibacteriales bacterium]